MYDTVAVDRALVPDPRDARGGAGDRADRRVAAPSPGCARSPRPISATACSIRARFLAKGGRFGVGSDSLVRVSAAEELRGLEYAQRLTQRSRNALGEEKRSTGRRLHEAACAGGAQALGRSIGAIAPGQRADIVVLDREHPSLAAAKGDVILDAWIFSADNAAVADVICGGAHVVRAGRHRDRERLLDPLPRDGAAARGDLMVLQASGKAARGVM